MEQRPKKMVVWAAVLTGAALAGLCGCNAPKDNLDVYNRFFQNGDLKQAGRFAERKLKKNIQPTGDNLLWTLQLGVVERMEGRFDQSTAWLDRSEAMMQTLANDNQLLEQLTAAAVNDNVIPYKGTIYDGIMANTYKAANFMQRGDWGLARVEFNRALDRQRRAKEDYAAQIQKRQDAINSNSNLENARRSTENAALQDRLREAYPSLYSFEPYPDFVNPFATYLAGVFFAATGDYERAWDALRESAGMMPQATYVWQDFDAVEAAINTQAVSLEPTVWVIFENGLGPVKEEFRIDLPLFIATDRMLYWGIALPRLAQRPAAAASLAVQADGQTVRTELVADIDRLVQTEFKKDFDVILLRAIISSTAKAAAQYALFKNTHNNDLWTIGMALYSFATTAADVRIWTSLPKNIQAARLRRPQDGWLTLTAGTKSPVQVELGDCRHAIVMVRMTTPDTTPIVDVIRF